MRCLPGLGQHVLMWDRGKRLIVRVVELPATSRAIYSLHIVWANDKAQKDFTVESLKTLIFNLDPTNATQGWITISPEHPLLRDI